jgi:hypothetical protein
MEAISSTDRFVALLRQKLAERAQAKDTAQKRRTQAARPEEAASPRRVATRVAQAGADDRDLRRTIVEQLLTDRFGSQFANGSRFQQIIEQVSDLIADDPELGAMMREVMAEVRR